MVSNNTFENLRNHLEQAYDQSQTGDHQQLLHHHHFWVLFFLGRKNPRFSHNVLLNLVGQNCLRKEVSPLEDVWKSQAPNLSSQLMSGLVFLELVQISNWLVGPVFPLFCASICFANCSSGLVWKGDNSCWNPKYFSFFVFKFKYSSLWQLFIFLFRSKIIFYLLDPRRGFPSHRWEPSHDNLN